MSGSTAGERVDRADDPPRDALVVDRIVDGRHAVLLVGPDEVELVVDVGVLPDGVGEGDWLRLGLRPDPELTAERRTDVEARLARVRDERRGGRFSAQD
jgi:hypothetical protein